ncbi:MAG: PEP-CTERM sorting domain-containing protein, partial [Rubrivivax sp.]
ATRVATFEPTSPGSSRYTLDGFGRFVNAAPVPTSFVQRSAADAATLASGSTSFHDRYQLVGLPPGVFSLDSKTPVTWSGGIGIFAVTISWLNGTPTVPFIDFDVDSANKTATGSGNFVAACDTCVFLDVYGTEDLSIAGQYGSKFQVVQVPEVQSYGLMLAGLGVLALWMRRRNTHA